MLTPKLFDMLKDVHAKSHCMYVFTSQGLSRYKADNDIQLLNKALLGVEAWSDDIELDISYENPVYQMTGWYLRALRAMNSGDLQDFIYAWISWKQEAERFKISSVQVDEEYQKEYDKIRIKTERIE